MVDYAVVMTNFAGAFPNIDAINVSAPGAGDGTEFVAALVNDIWGRAQALMDYAGLIPDGVQEAPDTAQILEAIGLGFGVGPGVGVIYWKNDTPAVHGDRVLLLQGQVILIATYPLLDAAVYVGDPDNPTAPAFFRTSDAGGTIRNVAGPYLVLPDCRGLSLKNIGDATIAARVKTGPVELGEAQEDQGQAYRMAIVRDGEAIGQRYTATSVAGAVARALWEAQAAAGVNLAADHAYTNGVNGNPRLDDNFRDSTLGTNYGITY